MTLSTFRVTAAAVLALGLGMSPHTGPRTQQLGGNQRYLTALSTDKPIYHPGDRVYARGVLLGAFHRTPFPGQAQAQIELKGPRGETVASGTTITQDGVWGFSWEVPEEASGGEYLLQVSYPFQGDPPAERKFDVRDFRAP